MSTWQDQAKQLSFGQTRKIVCCGTSPSAYISNSEKGIAHHCFRDTCDRQLFERHGAMSVKDWAKARERDKPLARKAWAPNVVPMNEAPGVAQLWLLQAGISPEMATVKYRIGWNEYTQRVIVPLSTARAVDSRGNWLPAREFIARAVKPGHNPKYIISAAAQDKFYYRHGNYGVCVVVEDILSCIKVNMAGYSCIAAMGTSLSLPLANKAAEHDNVISWLDGDAAGDKGHKRFRGTMGMWDVDLMRIRTERDPKLHSVSEIQALVGSRL